MSGSWPPLLDFFFFFVNMWCEYIFKIIISTFWLILPNTCSKMVFCHMIKFDPDWQKATFSHILIQILYIIFKKRSFWADLHANVECYLLFTFYKPRLGWTEKYASQNAPWRPLKSLKVIRWNSVPFQFRRYIHKSTSRHT